MRCVTRRPGKAPVGSLAKFGRLPFPNLAGALDSVESSGCESRDLPVDSSREPLEPRVLIVLCESCHCCVASEMCCRVVTKMEFQGIALVENPVQKYSVPF